MKLLIVGIDGGDERIIRAMPMPFLHALLDSGISLKLKEDLWSRGWAEMLSGYSGHETGAFYSKPILNGSQQFTQRFKKGDFKLNPDVTPLWEAVNSLGHSVGFMNIPSTYPASKIDNGFFVSGAGAGLTQNGFGGFPEGAVSSGNIRKILQRNDYIFDIRLTSSGIRELDVFFGTLASMIHRRTSAYLDLVKQEKPSMGFIAYMGLTRVQYVAMSEVEALIANGCNPASVIQYRILEIYKMFDAELQRLFEAITPKHYIFAADHGQAPYLYSVNMNSFLQQTGFLQAKQQTKKKMNRICKNTIKTSLRAVIPGNIRFKLLKNRLNPVGPLKTHTEWSSTHAFGARYVPGIYINDKRFNGPVSEAATKSIVSELLDAVNNSSEAKQHGLHARPYRELYSEAYYNFLLPDIWIDHPDTCFFVDNGSFVSANTNYGPIKSLWQVTGDMFTGIKGSCPLAFHDRGLSVYRERNDPKDLSVIYYLATRAMT